MINLSGDSMAKSKEKKNSSATKYDEAAKSKKGNRTLTGKKAGEIVITPKLSMMDNTGRPIRESVAVVVWGRNSIPSIGHETLIEAAYNLAVEENGLPFLFLSSSAGNKKNPLTVEQKVALNEEAFGDKVFVIPLTFSNPIEVLKVVAENFDNIVWLTGEDQADDYNRILEDYNNIEFTFKTSRVVSLPRNTESENLVESISATKLREAVVEGDIETFTKGLATPLQHKSAEIFESVREGLKAASPKVFKLIESKMLQSISENKTSKNA